VSAARDELRRRIADGDTELEEAAREVLREREQLDPKELADHVARRPGDPVTPPANPDDPFNLAESVPRR
jgi:hypothetical protein